MNASQKHYTEKKTKVKNYRFYDPIYMVFWKRLNYGSRKQKNSYKGWAKWEGFDYKGPQKKLFIVGIQ